MKNFIYRFSIKEQIFNKPVSSNFLPIICTPKGKPLLSKPAGTDIAGIPARLTEAVYISFRYIDRGSFIFSPILNAV